MIGSWLKEMRWAASQFLAPDMYKAQTNYWRERCVSSASEIRNILLEDLWNILGVPAKMGWYPSLDWLKSNWVHRIEIVQGVPCFYRTRIPIRVVADALDAGATSFDLWNTFPSLKESDFRLALDKSQEHLWKYVDISGFRVKDYADDEALGALRKKISQLEAELETFKAGITDV